MPSSKPQDLNSLSNAVTPTTGNQQDVQNSTASSRTEKTPLTTAPPKERVARENGRKLIRAIYPYERLDRKLNTGQKIDYIMDFMEVDRKTARYALAVNFKSLSCAINSILENENENEKNQDKRTEIYEKEYFKTDDSIHNIPDKLGRKLGK